MCLPPQHLEWQELASDYKPNSYLLARYVPGMPGISCIKAALALYVFLRKPQKTTIHNSLRSVKQTAVWRLKPFPLRSKVIRLQPAMPLLSPQGKNDRLRYRSTEWTLILRGPRD